jgi:hypothetical protein
VLRLVKEAEFVVADPTLMPLFLDPNPLLYNIVRHKFIDHWIQGWNQKLLRWGVGVKKIKYQSKNFTFYYMNFIFQQIKELMGHWLTSICAGVRGKHFFPNKPSCFGLSLEIWKRDGTGQDGLGETILGHGWVRITGEHGLRMGQDGFERSKIRKFRPDPCWTPTDTTLTDRDGWAKSRSGWGETFFFISPKK